jgi:hypothetical protein
MRGGEKVKKCFLNRGLLYKVEEVRNLSIRLKEERVHGSRP